MEELKSQLAEKDVAIYGLVSEPQAKADVAKSEWNISYDVIGLQDVSLVKYLEDEKIINLVISEHKDKETYPNGMVQPGLLFIRSSLTCRLVSLKLRQCFGLNVENMSSKSPKSPSQSQDPIPSRFLTSSRFFRQICMKLGVSFARIRSSSPLQLGSTSRSWISTSILFRNFSIPCLKFCVTSLRFRKCQKAKLETTKPCEPVL